MIVQCLQGLTATQSARIWQRHGSFYAIAEAQMKADGVRIHEVSSAWELLKQFRSSVKGAVLYRLGTPSLNVATSLCGAMEAVAIDESLRERAEAAGLKVLADVREMTEPEAFAKYRTLFGQGVAVEQGLDKPANLRDFAVAHRAFTFATRDREFRRKVVSDLGPHGILWGWGPDEYQFVSDLSRSGATAGPADWCLNLSVLETLPAGTLKRPVRAAQPQEDGVRYVAFVMSDGDNVQWMCGDFIGNTKFWDSPLRGTFPMTWEVSALLGDVAPRVLQHLYATAKPDDAFVAGAGLPGYTFPHFQPDPNALAQQANPLLKKTDLPFISVLNANEGSMAEADPLLELPEVKGILYKDYSPYNRSNGALHWLHGKPCLSYKFLLWENLMGPADLARGIAAMPAAPRTDPASFAIINVHAWSYGNSGGPMEAIRQAIALLPPNTRVTTADHVLTMLRTNFGKSHAAT
ncbi:MAG: hypothetical protein JWL77_5791 [Chthonomonadaceae bacterium]|nr:hypothetical protein [Chthonomonadaceae bacterium]